MLPAFLFNAFFAFSVVVAMGQMPTEHVYGPDPRHKLDVYLPHAPENAPVIVMQHGGAWQAGDKRGRNIWHAKVSHWRPKGFIFVSVNTRLRPHAGPLMQTRDLAQAMAFVQRNLKDWGGDPRRIFLMGHSSGAHVATLLAVRQDLQASAKVAPWAGTIALDSAAWDVVDLMQNDPPGWLAKAFGPTPEYWQETSPVAHLDPQDRPILAICARPNGASCSNTERFAQAATQTGVKIEIISVPYTHAQTNNRVGSDPGYTSGIDDWINAQ